MIFGVGAALSGVELVAVGVDGVGALVAVVALGGAVGSVAYGRRSWRRAPGSQLVVLCAGLTGALLATLAVRFSDVLFPVALFVSGLVIAPALVVGYGLADRLTGRTADPEAGALVNTANNLGISLGTAVTAFVLDGVGAAAALLAVAAVGAATVLVGPHRDARCRRRVRRTRAYQPSSPCSSVNVPVGPSGPIVARRTTVPALSSTDLPIP